MFIIPFYFSHWNKALSGLIYQDLLFFFFTSNSHRIQATHPFWKPDFYTSELMLQVVVNTINKYIYINHSHQFKKLEYSCTQIFFNFKTCNIVCACLYCKGRLFKNFNPLTSWMTKAWARELDTFIFTLYWAQLS